MSDADVFDPAALDRLVRFGGVKLLDALVDTFRTNGRERIDAGRRAVAEGNQDGAKLAFHSLKSSAAQLGAAALSRLCAEAEALAKEGDLADLASRLPAIERAYTDAVEWMRTRGDHSESPT